MNKLLFEQPKLTVESFSAKEDVLLWTSAISVEEGIETSVFKIPAITAR